MLFCSHKRAISNATTGDSWDFSRILWEHSSNMLVTSQPFCSSIPILCVFESMQVSPCVGRPRLQSCDQVFPKWLWSCWSCCDLATWRLRRRPDCLEVVAKMLRKCLADSQPVGQQAPHSGYTVFNFACPLEPAYWKDLGHPWSWILDPGFWIWVPRSHESRYTSSLLDTIAQVDTSSFKSQCFDMTRTLTILAPICNACPRFT